MSKTEKLNKKAVEKEIERLEVEKNKMNEERKTLEEKHTSNRKSYEKLCYAIDNLRSYLGFLE